MTSAGRRTAFAFVLALAAGAIQPLPVSADAGTRISVSGTHVTITVYLDIYMGVYFGDQPVVDTDGAILLPANPMPEETRTEVRKLGEDAQNYWNRGLDGRTYRDCLTIEVDFVVEAVDREGTSLAQRTAEYLGWATVPGHHVVHWLESEWGSGPMPQIYDPYDEDGVAMPGEDFASPYDSDLDGVFSPELETTRDWAHELGHLLGFGDDYDRHGAPLPGREGTLMSSGGDFVDQGLLDRLGKLIDGVEPNLPTCWKGTMRSETSRDYSTGTRCWDVWESALRFTIDMEGKISGDGNGTVVSGPACTQPAPEGPYITGQRFAISGDADRSRLRLGFALDGNSSVPAGAGMVTGLHTLYVASFDGPAVEIPRSECRADGSPELRRTDLDYSNDLHVSRNAISLTCSEEW